MSQDVQDILAGIQEVQASQGDAYLPYVRPIHPMSQSTVSVGNWAIRDEDLGETLDVCLVKYRLTLEAEVGEGDDKETISEHLYPEDIEGSWATSDQFVKFMKENKGATYNVDCLLYVPKAEQFAIHSVKQRRMDNFKALVQATAPMSGIVATFQATLTKGKGNRSWFTMTATPTDQTVDLEALSLYESSVTIFDSNK